MMQQAGFPTRLQFRHQPRRPFVGSSGPLWGWPVLGLLPGATAPLLHQNP